MSLNLILGLAAIGYGLYTAILRARKPEAFGKLQAMRDQWGHGPGTAVHVVSYTVVPMVLGLVLVASALRAQ